MQIDVSVQKANVAVTVVKPRGDLDSATYTELIDAVRKVIAEGAKDLVIDLSDVPFLSSAGLMAIHSIALLLSGERPPELESRGEVLKRVGGSSARAHHTHVKLAGMRTGVASTFEKAGFLQFFDVSPDVEAAVASF
jgi:anti-anti-sigma regulatory factor